MSFGPSFAIDPTIFNKVVASNDRFVSSVIKTAQKVAKWASSTFHSLRDYIRVTWNASSDLKDRVRKLPNPEFELTNDINNYKKGDYLERIQNWNDMVKNYFRDKESEQNQCGVVAHSLNNSDSDSDSEKSNSKLEDQFVNAQKKAQERQKRGEEIDPFFKNNPEALWLEKPKDPQTNEALKNYQVIAEMIKKLSEKTKVSEEDCIKHLVPKAKQHNVQSLL